MNKKKQNQLRQQKAGRRIPESLKNTKLTAIMLCGAALTAIVVCLVAFESEFLWKVQELNLHLDTPLFFKQQMVVAGGFLTWLGTYFTEFFYHPLPGSLLLVAWWALLIFLMQRAFRVPVKWLTLLLIPVALLLITCMDTGYWIYYLKLRGHMFVATMGMCFVSTAVWLFRCLPSRFFARQLFIAVITALLYPLIGFYALLAALVMGIMIWRIEGVNATQRTIGSIVALLAIVVVPLIYYRAVFYQTSIANIWWTALPLYRIQGESTTYYIPYYLLVLFSIVMAATFGRMTQAPVKNIKKWWATQALLLLVLCIGVRMFWFSDYNFHKELRMQRCMEQEDWDGILAEAADLQDEPTRAIVMMKNLALFRLGRQGDEMYHYRTGAKATAAVFNVNMTQVVGRSIYFYYGLPNYCYRWCLEDGVEYGWRAEYLKYMIRCALVNAEWRVAAKYIDILKHTRYHRQWAERYEKLLYNDDAVLADKNFAAVRHLMNFKDRLNSDQAIIEQFLMNHFTYDKSDDPLYQEQAVYAALWQKDIQTFWPLFFEYANSHKDQHMPTHLQEAAFLYGNLEHEVDISRMPFDESVVNTYKQFMQMAERCKGMSEEQMKEVFYEPFGKTFFYEYFLIRNQKLY